MFSQIDIGDIAIALLILSELEIALILHLLYKTHKYKCHLKEKYKKELAKKYRTYLDEKKAKTNYTAKTNHAFANRTIE